MLHQWRSYCVRTSSLRHARLRFRLHRTATHASRRRTSHCATSARCVVRPKHVISFRGTAIRAQVPRPRRHPVPRRSIPTILFAAVGSAAPTRQLGQRARRVAATASALAQTAQANVAEMDRCDGRHASPCATGGHARMETSDDIKWDWDRIWKIRPRLPVEN